MGTASSLLAHPLIDVAPRWSVGPVDAAVLHGRWCDSASAWRWPLIELAQNRDAVIDLNRRFGVSSLSVFGSAASGDSDPTRSDIDFLVEFDPPTGMSRFDAFSGLKDALEDLLGRPVDLISRTAVINPFLAESIARTQEQPVMSRTRQCH